MVIKYTPIFTPPVKPSSVIYDTERITARLDQQKVSEEIVERHSKSDAIRRIETIEKMEKFIRGEIDRPPNAEKHTVVFESLVTDDKEDITVYDSELYDSQFDKTNEELRDEYILDGTSCIGKPWFQEKQNKAPRPENIEDFKFVISPEEIKKLSTEEMMQGYREFGLPDDLSEEEIARMIEMVRSPANSPKPLAVIGRDEYNFNTGNSVANTHRELDNIAALYAYYSNKVNSKFTGEEHESMMKRVDDVFSKAVTERIDLFVRGDTYISADVQGVRDSLSHIYDQRKGVYQDAIKSEDFLAGIEGTQYECLMQSAYFMTAKLRQYTDAKGDMVDDTKGGKYSVKDLKAISLINRLGGGLLGGVENEEMLGLQIGITMISIQMVMNMDELISFAIKELIARSMEISINKSLDDINKKLDFSRQDEFTDHTFEYDKLDEEAVRSAIDVMLKTLDADNFEDAYNKATETLYQRMGKKLYDQTFEGRVQDRYAVLVTYDAYKNEKGLFAKEYKERVNPRRNLNAVAKLTGQHKYISTGSYGIYKKVNVLV